VVLISSIIEIKKRLGRYYWDHSSKMEFLRSCKQDARLLDVGCGNSSPATVKYYRPDIYYVGLDVGDYNQADDPRGIADEYILVSPEGFASSLEAMPTSFDAVISSHNIEHCIDPERTLSAMMAALLPGGRIFLSFPAEVTVGFPKRKGTLNFYDDPTHVWLPSFSKIKDQIQAAGLRIDVAIKRYRPLRYAIRGLLKEPRNFLNRTADADTWALYGFESIIWATRPMTPGSSRD
jgi:SAM-dependent methyltransferase